MLGKRIICEKHFSPPTIEGKTKMKKQIDQIHRKKLKKFHKLREFSTIERCMSTLVALKFSVFCTCNLQTKTTVESVNERRGRP